MTDRVLAAWLAELGLERYAQLFGDNDIDLRTLPLLSESDLTQLGVTSFGHRKLLLKAISALGGDDAARRAGAPRHLPPPPTTTPSAGS